MPLYPPPAAGGSGIRVEDEGSSIVAAATGLNFAGSGVVVTDAGSNEALVTIAGGGSGGIDEGRLVVSATTYYRIPGFGGFSSNSSKLLVVDTLYYAPIIVDADWSYDAVSIFVQTNVAVSTVRAGLFAVDEAWAPTSVVKDYGTFDTSTTGLKTISFSSETITAGRYLVGFVGTHAVTLRPIICQSPFVTPAGLVNGVIVDLALASRGTGAFGSAPAAASAVTGSNNGFLHCVFFRGAA